jgi:peptide deformylase
MKRPIYYYGHPVLRVKAKLIAKIDEEIIQLANDMIETMIHYNGIGLAAPQIGVSLRIFVIREEILNPDGNYSLGPNEVIINPVLSSPSKETETMLEGCLSLPKLHVEVSRPKKITVRYQNLKGEYLEETLDTFRGRMMMHENDHLNGVLTIDRMDPKERKKIDPFLREIKELSQSPIS